MGAFSVLKFLLETEFQCDLKVPFTEETGNLLVFKKKSDQYLGHGPMGLDLG